MFTRSFTAFTLLFLTSFHPLLGQASEPPSRTECAEGSILSFFKSAQGQWKGQYQSTFVSGPGGEIGNRLMSGYGTLQNNFSEWTFSGGFCSDRLCADMIEVYQLKDNRLFIISGDLVIQATVLEATPTTLVFSYGKGTGNDTTVYQSLRENLWTRVWMSHSKTSPLSHFTYSLARLTAH